MLEYESVLTRPEHLAACGAITEQVSAVLDELALVCERVELAVRLRPMLSDPNDEMVLETRPSKNHAVRPPFSFSSRCLLCCSLNGAPNPLIGGAAADVAHHGFVDFFPGGMRIPGQ